MSLPTESVFVYWENAASETADADNPTATFSTIYEGGAYDATTLLRCKAKGNNQFGQCQAGILRTDDRQASLDTKSPRGKAFNINFLMTDYVNATVGEADAQLKGVTWIVTRDNGEV